MYFANTKRCKDSLSFGNSLATSIQSSNDSMWVVIDDDSIDHFQLHKTAIRMVDVAKELLDDNKSLHRFAFAKYINR